MAAASEKPRDLAGLGELLRAVEPAALLVPPRILRRVIRTDRALTGIGLAVPHATSYVIARDRLLAIVEPRELGLGPDRELPPSVILLAQPAAEPLASHARAEVLVRLWRLLFHARIHQALEQEIAEERLTEAVIRRRIHQIGQAEFHEVRTVLRQEHILLPPRDEPTAYVEFAAVFLELRHFAPSLLPRYFPGILSYETIDALLTADLDAADLFARSRVPGAPDPTAPVPHAPALTSQGTASPPAAGTPSEARCRRLLARADRAAAVGNAVRAVILRTRAAAVAPPRLTGPAGAGARTELDRLARRLRDALGPGPGSAAQWRQALAPLRECAARGIWPVEARLLYDLQRVCVDHEREVQAVDLAGRLFSLGRRPLRRTLPHQSEVLALKHLRSAARRLRTARLADDDRARLSRLLSSAIEETEHHLRDDLRPLVAGAITGAGLEPASFPERVALDKLTEELLDQVGDRGHLNLGRLRDAVSRNNLKLPDLSGPGEFVFGDPLLRANRSLSEAIDGIYHRGEVYLRGLQRLSSLAFGTRPGRFLVRYLALPFGGAAVALAGLYFLVEEVTKLLHYVDNTIEPVHLEPLLSPLSIGLLGIFLFLLMHVPAFRQAVGRGLRHAFRGVRALLIDLPSFLLGLPLVRRVLGSLAFRRCFHYGLKPLAVALPVALLLRAPGHSPALPLGAGLATFLASALLLNSRLARDLEEGVIDRLALGWQRLRADILPGLFRLVMDFFKRLVEIVDRLLYAVDEWLRFRGGEGRLTLAVKAVLGLCWGAVAYVVRFAISLLVEPQVNPIKHFPVVTVAHKLLLPLLPSAASALALAMDKDLALLVATAITFGTPGVFGFLVWELKENWRLYRANRPEQLGPVAIGHHGETMLRLLRPGFHSGTLPKLYARLRRAERRALRGGRRQAVRKYDEALHQVEEAVRHFVERKLLAFLKGSKSWGGLRLTAGAIALGSNRIRIELCCPDLPGSGMWLAFEEQAGWLVAGIAEAGWLPGLARDQVGILRIVLAGFYKFAGVHLVREQVESYFEPQRITFDVGDEGLVVWVDEVETVYDLREEGPIATALLFSSRALPWTLWVETWERDQDGKRPPEAFLEGVRLLPRLAV